MLNIFLYQCRLFFSRRDCGGKVVSFLLFCPAQCSTFQLHCTVNIAMTALLWQHCTGNSALSTLHWQHGNGGNTALATLHWKHCNIRSPLSDQSWISSCRWQFCEFSSVTFASRSNIVTVFSTCPWPVDWHSLFIGQPLGHIWPLDLRKNSVHRRDLE